MYYLILDNNTTYLILDNPLLISYLMPFDLIFLSQFISQGGVVLPWCLGT